MPSSDSLPWPAEWPEHSGARYLPAVIVIAVLGLGGVAVGFGFVAIGEPGGLKYGLLFGAMFLLVAVFAYGTRVRRPNGTGDIALGEVDGRPVTEVRYSLLAFVCLVGLMGCMTAILVLAALDFQVRAPGGGAVIVFGLLGVLSATFLVLVLLGRLRRGGLTLSSVGIHQRGWAFSSFLPWEAFAGVKAAYNGRPEVLLIAYANATWEKRQVVRSWKIDKLPPVPMIEVDCSVLAMPPELVFWLLKFYVEHPGARVELGTDAVLARVRAGAFATP